MDFALHYTDCYNIIVSSLKKSFLPPTFLFSIVENSTRMFYFSFHTKIYLRTVMNNYQQKVEAFLNCKNIAVAGVSRKGGTSVGNPIYKKFKSAGYSVFQVNPKAEVIDNDKCYANLKSIPSNIEAVMVCTNPNDSLHVVKECKELGIKNIWFHKTMGNGSYSEKAIEYCRKNGINAIESGCPMMHLGNVDFPHKCMHFILNFLGKLKT